jgi:hypothetical protein
MHPFPTTCPVCAGGLHITGMACNACQTTIQGQYTLGWIGRLSREQLTFVELLVKNRGNVNGVAADLKVAYNTARSRLDDIISALGYATPLEQPRHDRRAVLDRVAAGELSAEEAMQLLRS